MLNVGIIGTGEIATRFLVPALHLVPGARLWSVLSRDQDRAGTFAQQFRAASLRPSFDDIDRFLEDPHLDSVIIATPDKLHCPQTLAAATAGKHVFVEKPMATNGQDAELMIDACSTAGVKLAVGYHHRWHLGHRWVKDYLQNNSDKDGINHFYAHWAYPAAELDDWRNNKDLGQWWSLAALGTHCIDLCLWLMDDHGKITESHAIMSNFATTKDHSAAITLQFESSALAQIHVSFVSAYKKEVVLATDDRHIVCHDTLGPRGAGKIEIYSTKERKIVKSFAEIANPYQLELIDFVQAIKQNRDPEVNGSVGLKNVQILERLVSD